MRLITKGGGEWLELTSAEEIIMLSIIKRSFFSKIEQNHFKIGRLTSDRNFWVILYPDNIITCLDRYGDNLEGEEILALLRMGLYQKAIDTFIDFFCPFDYYD